MKIKICAENILIIAAILLFFFDQINAADFELHPRLETGVMFYSIEIDAESQAIPTAPNETSGYNKTQKEIEFSDTMPFVGCGATFFVNRFFVDLSSQYTSDGKDHAEVSGSEYLEQSSYGTSLFSSEVIKYHSKFDRTDNAVSVGYAVTHRFSVFVGYKWAVTDLDTTFDGPFSLLSIDDWGTSSSDNWLAHGNIVGEEHQKFKYQGPFIGIAHGWSVERFSIFQGLFSVNAGLAHLDSKLSRNRYSTLSVYLLNGQEIEPIVSTSQENREIKGQALGLTVGLGWRGMTSLKNLSYSIGISGYRYQFDSDDSDASDINETAVTFKIGLAYAF